MKRTIQFYQGSIKDIALLHDGNNSSIYITLSNSLPPDGLSKAHEALQRINDILNITPDDYPYNPGEQKDSQGKDLISSDQNQSTLYWQRNGEFINHTASIDAVDSHHLVGDRHTVHINKIAETDLSNVAAKLLRAMRAELLITEGDMKRAYMELSLPRKGLDYVRSSGDGQSR